MGVKLALLHPQIIERSCARCQTWLHDDQHRCVLREGKPVRRPAGAPTPCWKCPKQSPKLAASYERDLERIGRMLDLYFRVRATNGRCLSEAQARDPLTARYLAIIDGLVRGRQGRGPQTGELVVT
jgi:hypothetical protein